MTFPGKVKIEVGLPGQDCSFVTLEIIRTHVRMQVAPVVVGDGRVVATTFVGAIETMTGESNVRSNRWCLDARKAGHAGELLPWGRPGGLELAVDVVRGGGGEW